MDEQPTKMNAGDGEPHTAKRLRVSERTMLACSNCKQRKLKVDFPSPPCLDLFTAMWLESDSVG
jgi:hypothetical protein